MRLLLVTFAALALGAFCAIVQPWQLHAQPLGGRYGIVQGFSGGDVSSATGFPAGTVGAPGIYWVADSDGTGTGLYRTAANVIGFTSNGAQIYKISDSGNNAVFAKDTGSYYKFLFGSSEKFAVINDTPKQIQLNAQTVCGTNNVDGELRCKNSGETALARLLIGWKGATIAADDTTPDVSGAVVFTTSANSGATAITDIDSPSPGQMVTICGGSDTNSSTIADSGNFNLSAAFTANADDCITLYVVADNDYIEVSRVNN